MNATNLNDRLHGTDDDRSMPFLSITVLNYNYAHYLQQCLDSILKQTFRDFEVILINDRSTDNSLKVIEPYLADPRVRLVDHKANKGYVESLIEGCQLSTGDYITVISADDYALDLTAFETAYEVLKNDEAISLFFSAWHEVDEDGVVRYTRRASEHDYVVDGALEIRRLLMSSPILHSGTIIRRDAYHQVGGYDARCKYAIDNNMWLALCATGKVAYVDRPLYAYRAHDTNMSNTDGAFERTQYEMLLGIDYALSLFTDEMLPDKQVLRRRARQRALVAVPTHDIFAGRYRRGWYGYWQAIRMDPALSLMQPRILSVTARTLLGKSLYERLRPPRSVFDSMKV